MSLTTTGLTAKRGVDSKRGCGHRLHALVWRVLRACSVFFVGIRNVWQTQVAKVLVWDAWYAVWVWQVKIKTPNTSSSKDVSPTLEIFWTVQGRITDRHWEGLDSASSHSNYTLKSMNHSMKSNSYGEEGRPQKREGAGKCIDNN